MQKWAEIVIYIISQILKHFGNVAEMFEFFNPISYRLLLNS